MLLVVSLAPTLVRSQFLDHGGDETDTDDVHSGRRRRVPVVGAHFEAGGRGIVAARALKDLSAAVRLVCIRGGATGQALTECLEAARIPATFVDSLQPTPITYRVHAREHGGALVREYVDEPPALGGGEMRAVLDVFDDSLTKAGGVLLTGGCAARGVDFLLAELCRVAREQSVPVLFLGAGEALFESRDAPPEWVLCGRADLARSVSDLGRSETRLTTDLFARGCRAVVVSDGPRPVRIITSEGELKLVPPETRDRAGPSPREAMAAMMLLRLTQAWDLQPAVAYGMAIGTAQTQKTLGGRLRMADVEGFYRQIRGVVKNRRSRRD